MVHKYKLIPIILLISLKSHATSFFIPDSDSAALIEIALILAKDFQTTLRLLEVAKSTQRLLGDVHDNISRKYYLTKRIEYRLRRLKRLSKLHPKTLKEVNRAIALLKYNYQSTERLFRKIGKELVLTKDAISELVLKKSNPPVSQSTLDQREGESATGSTLSQHTSNTAINTALTNKILHQSHQDQLDQQKRQLSFQAVFFNSHAKKLQERVRLEKWSGISSTYKLKEESGGVIEKH